MEDIKQASNFELNVLTIGNKRFQLVKGDRFTTNGATFQYVPSTAENKAKLPFGNYHRDKSISAKKYQRDVERADNIKLVVDRGLSEHEPEDSEYNVQNRWREWEVQYAYVQPLPEFEPLIIMHIEKDYSGSWKFKADQFEIERETKSQYFLKSSHPVHYRSRIEKAELNLPMTDNSKYHVICKLDDYDQMEVKLFKYAKKQLEEQIENAKMLLKMRKDSLADFVSLEEKQGYQTNNP